MHRQAIVIQMRFGFPRAANKIFYENMIFFFFFLEEEEFIAFKKPHNEGVTVALFPQPTYTNFANMFSFLAKLAKLFKGQSVRSGCQSAWKAQKFTYSLADNKDFGTFQ